MAYFETGDGIQIKALLTDEELGLPALDDLVHKYYNWVKLAKEAKGGRKTRSANRKGDILYEEIMAFKLPPIKVHKLATPVKSTSNDSKDTNYGKAMNTPETSTMDSDSDTSTSSRPITRSLRSRSRTPTLQQQPVVTNSAQKAKLNQSKNNMCTPQNQRLRSRANIKQGSGDSANSCASSALRAALDQQHPSLSVTKLRQLYRADSAQKKREKEEKERQERIMTDRKLKEEKAEALKRQMLEQRAHNAKLRREERLNHAADVRKAREEARIKKAAEEAKKLALQQQQQQLRHQQQQQQLRQEQQQKEQQQQQQSLQNQAKNQKAAPTAIPHNKQNGTKTNNHREQNQKVEVNVADTATTSTVNNITTSVASINETQEGSQHQQSQQQVEVLNETFKVPTSTNNIDIIIQDETDDGSAEKVTHTAAWARAPYLREALIEQFSKSYDDGIECVSKVFRPLRSIKNIELSEIFGKNSAVDRKYLARTSSAVWTPPNRSIKRTSSQLT